MERSPSVSRCATDKPVADIRSKKRVHAHQSKESGSATGGGGVATRSPFGAERVLRSRLAPVMAPVMAPRWSPGGAPSRRVSRPAKLRVQRRQADRRPLHQRFKVPILGGWGHQGPSRFARPLVHVRAGAVVAPSCDRAVADTVTQRRDRRSRNPRWPCGGPGPVHHGDRARSGSPRLRPSARESRAATSRAPVPGRAERVACRSRVVRSGVSAVRSGQVPTRWPRPWASSSAARDATSSPPSLP